MILHLVRIIVALPVLIGASLAWPATPGKPSHLRLLDRLDRPGDGYCLDIPGFGRNLRLALPLFAHNCKPGLTADSAVVFTSNGLIRFPAVKLCITVAGVNSGALPGASILLRPCSGSRLQHFTLHRDGRLELTGSKLCLTVGSRSAATYSPSDRWRALFVDDCARAAPARSRWQFVVPR